MGPRGFLLPPLWGAPYRIGPSCPALWDLLDESSAASCPIRRDPAASGVGREDVVGRPSATPGGDGGRGLAAPPEQPSAPAAGGTRPGACAMPPLRCTQRTRSQVLSAVRDAPSPFLVRDFWPPSDGPVVPRMHRCRDPTKMGVRTSAVQSRWISITAGSVHCPERSPPPQKRTGLHLPRVRAIPLSNRPSRIGKRHTGARSREELIGSAKVGENFFELSMGANPDACTHPVGPHGVVTVEDDLNCCERTAYGGRTLRPSSGTSGSGTHPTLREAGAPSDVAEEGGWSDGRCAREDDPLEQPYLGPRHGAVRHSHVGGNQGFFRRPGSPSREAGAGQKV